MKSLFNTAQQDFLDSFIPTLRAKGYKYYVAYTNTNVNNVWGSTTQPDLYIVASTEEITATSAYRYNCPQGSVRYSVRTVNYSTSNNAVNTDRVTSVAYSGTLTVNAYEHIYTNAVFTGATLQPDILGGELYAETSYVNSGNFILAVLLIYLVIWNMWSIRK